MHGPVTVPEAGRRGSRDERIGELVYEEGGGSGPGIEANMQAISCRRPNLGDGMILVVASAIALGITRQVEPPPYLVNLGPTFGATFAVQKWGLPWLVALAWAVMTIRLRRPRPSLRRIWRQPGAVGLAMAVVSSLYAGILILGRSLKLAFFGYPSGLSVSWSVGNYLAMMINAGGMLIAGSWLALALTRRLRRERGWIDGLGFLIAIAWVVADLALTTFRMIFL